MKPPDVEVFADVAHVRMHSLDELSAAFTQFTPAGYQSLL